MRIRERFFLGVICCASAFPVGCASEAGTGATITRLCSKEHALQCELQILKDSITSAWDGFVAEMELHLPDTMPDEERANMVKVRNGSLIRMFESYGTLDPEIDDELVSVEKLDRAIAVKTSAIRREITGIEMERNALLATIEMSGGRALANQYLLKCRSAVQQSCK